MSQIETEQYLQHRKLTEEERRVKSQHYLQKYEDSVPVFICSISEGIAVPQSKLLLKRVYTISQFIRNIKRTGTQSKESVLYVYARDRILKPTETFEQVYQRHQDSDGFLYLRVSEMPALGGESLNGSQ